MKKNLFLFFLLANVFSVSAQYRPAVVGLKTGDSVSGIIGDIQRKTFKYKTQTNGKPEKIDFSKIDFVRILYSGRDVKTYRFFRLNDDEKFTQVQQLATGKNAELYGVSSYTRSPGIVAPSIGQEVVRYYVKKPEDEKLTMLGIYDPLIGNLKENVINYFSDCPELTEKIQSKEFKVRKDLEAIVEFYNSNCNSSI